MPSVIHNNEQGLGTNIALYQGSIMSYNDGHYLASPHELYLGFINEDRIAKPTKDAEFTLHEADSPGTALAQLPITNQALKELIGSKTGQKFVSDYKLMIGKPEGQAVTVYAAMSPEKYAERGGFLPIITIDMLDGAGDTLTLEGDVKITVVQTTTDTADVRLQLI